MLIKVIQNFHFFFIILFLIFSFTIFEYIAQSNKEDKINRFLGFLVLNFVLIHLLIFLNLMSQDVSLYDFIFPVFLLILILIPTILGLTLIISSISVLIYKKLKGSNAKIQEFKTRKLEKFKLTSSAKKDNYRKINHVFIFFGMLIVWFIGVYLVYSASGSLKGMIPDENDMGALYLQILTQPGGFSNSLLALGWFYYILFFFFYGFFFFMFVNEISRKSLHLSFPTNIFTTLFLNEKEKNRYGSYFYFAVSHLFASFITPPLVYFAILGISSLADLSASQVGIRYGKRKISWNSNKTWEGCIVSSLVSFLICFIFIGIWWATIFSIIMIIVDLLTTKPLDVSDNLLIPLFSSVTYVLIRTVFNLNYSSIILSILT